MSSTVGTRDQAAQQREQDAEKRAAAQRSAGFIRPGMLLAEDRSIPGGRVEAGKSMILADASAARTSCSDDPRNRL